MTPAEKARRNILALGPLLNFDSKLGRNMPTYNGTKVARTPAPNAVGRSTKLSNLEATVEFRRIKRLWLNPRTKLGKVLSEG